MWGGLGKSAYVYHGENGAACRRRYFYCYRASGAAADSRSVGGWRSVGHAPGRAVWHEPPRYLAAPARPARCGPGDGAAPRTRAAIPAARGATLRGARLDAEIRALLALASGSVGGLSGGSAWSRMSATASSAI